MIKEVTNLVKLLEKNGRKKRLCRRFTRNRGWWDTVKNSYNEEIFKEMFRMSRGTFYYILGKIEPVIVKEHNVEAPIPPDMRLAIYIYKLTRGDYNYTIAEMAGVAKSTVCQIIIDVCKAIAEMLWEE